MNNCKNRKKKNLPVGHSQKNSAPKPSIHWPPFEQWGFSLFPNNVVALQIDTSISQFKPEKRKRRNLEIVKYIILKFESEKRIELLVYKTADLIWRAFFIRKFDWHLIGLIYKGVAKQPWHYIDPRSMLLEKKAVKSLEYKKKNNINCLVIVCIFPSF